MAVEAEAEPERIEPEMRTPSEVLAVRVLIYQAMGKRELMREIAKALRVRKPHALTG